MKIMSLLMILVSLVVLAVSEDSALDTKILVSIPQEELSKEISSIKSLVKDMNREISSIRKDLNREISSIKSEQAKINTAIAKGVEQEEKHYKQLETALEKIQGKEIQTATPSTSGPSPASAPTSSPETTPSVYTGEQRLLAFDTGKAKWDSDSGSPHDVEEAFEKGNYGCAGWDASADSWKKPFPIMIWYEFTSAVVPAEVSFRRMETETTPKTWHFVGSKQEGCRHESTWKPLCGDMVGNEKSFFSGQNVGCDVPKNARESFKCLGIRVYATNYREWNAVCLSEIRFWEISRTY